MAIQGCAVNDSFGTENDSKSSCLSYIQAQIIVPRKNPVIVQIHDFVPYLWPMLEKKTMEHEKAVLVGVINKNQGLEKVTEDLDEL